MTSERVTQFLLAFIAAGWLGDIVRGYYQNKKIKANQGVTDANATQIIITSATTMLEPLTRRVKQAETDAESLRKDLIEARREVAKLVAQLQESTAENKRVTSENRRLRVRLGEIPA